MFAEIQKQKNDSIKSQKPEETEETEETEEKKHSVKLEEKIKFPGIKYKSLERESVINIPSNLKHILIFGQARQGKSSIVNLMLNNNKKNGADVSDTVKGCSFSTEPWFNDEYCFWDTAGLNEQDQGSIVNAQATKNLIKFVKESQGFHGAIMVVSWSNISTATTKRNWELFYDAFLDKRIPIILCITGRGIETADEDQRWINKEIINIKSLGYVDKDGKVQGCVVYSKELSEVNHLFQEYYVKLRKQSQKYISDLLRLNVTEQFYNPLANKDWFEVFKKLFNTLAKFFGLDSLKITVRKGLKELLIKLGFSYDEAYEIACENYLNE